MNGLQKRRLEREAPGLVHVLESGSGPELPPELAEREAACCMGAAVYGLGRCTCWIPIYEPAQEADPQVGVLPPVRAECCFDCAYRNGSPERDRGEGDELIDVAGTPGNVFACHTGMRRVVAWKHPLLGDCEIPAGPGDYRPPIIDGIAYRADGRPAELCAGWAAHRRGLLGTVIDQSLTARVACCLDPDCRGECDPDRDPEREFAEQEAAL